VASLMKTPIFIAVFFSLFICSGASLTIASEDPYQEVTPLLSFYSGDVLRTSTLGGFQYTYHLTRMYWLGVGFLGGTVSIDQPNGVGLTSGDRFLGAEGTFYLNVPALLGAAIKGDDGLAVDLYSSFSVGHFWLDTAREIYGSIGGGMLLHLPINWLAFRFDLKGIFFRLENENGADFNSDMALSLGPSIKF